MQDVSIWAVVSAPIAAFILSTVYYIAFTKEVAGCSALKPARPPSGGTMENCCQSWYGAGRAPYGRLAYKKLLLVTILCGTFSLQLTPHPEYDDYGQQFHKPVAGMYNGKLPGFIFPQYSAG